MIDRRVFSLIQTSNILSEPEVVVKRRKLSPNKEKNVQLDSLLLQDIASRINLVNRISLERVSHRFANILRSSSSRKTRISLTINNNNNNNNNYAENAKAISKANFQENKAAELVDIGVKAHISDRKATETVISRDDLNSAVAAISARITRYTTLRVALRVHSDQSPLSILRAASGSVLRSIDNTDFKGISTDGKKAETVLQYTNAKIVLVVL